MEQAYRSKRHILDLHVRACSSFAVISKQAESVLECNIWVRQATGGICRVSKCRWCWWVSQWLQFQSLFIDCRLNCLMATCRTDPGNNNNNNNNNNGCVTYCILLYSIRTCRESYLTNNPCSIFIKPKSCPFLYITNAEMVLSKC